MVSSIISIRFRTDFNYLKLVDPILDGTRTERGSKYFINAREPQDSTWDLRVTETARETSVSADAAPFRCSREQVSFVFYDPATIGTYDLSSIENFSAARNESAFVAWQLFKSRLLEVVD